MSLFVPDLYLVSQALFESPGLDLVSLLDFEMEDQFLVLVVADTLKNVKIFDDF